ncbi:hypothetical protein KFE98_15420 [bacterium SCSIO 12741]|nr:hypothetical protein KFE98_15420 [bacterium SCSIO 12741]
MMKRIIPLVFLAAFLAISPWSNGQNFYTVTGNSASYDNAGSRDNIHLLDNGNVVKVSQLSNVNPGTGNVHDGIQVLILNPAGDAVFSERLFYDDIQYGGGLVDLKLQNSCLDADGNLFIATLFRASPAGTISNPGNLLNRNTAVIKLDINGASNAYSYNNWIVYSYHFANSSYGQNVRYPKQSRIAYIPSLDQLFFVVNVGYPYRNGPATLVDDCQHLVLNLLDPASGQLNTPPWQNVVAMTDRFGENLFIMDRIGEVKGDLFITGTMNIYYDPNSPPNAMPSIIKINPNTLGINGRVAVRGDASYTGVIGGLEASLWLHDQQQPFFVLGYHGFNAFTGVTVVDINLNPVLSKEIITPNFFETYPYDIDYDAANDEVVITCQSDDGIGRLTLDPNSSYSAISYWSAENGSTLGSITPEGTLLKAQSNWFPSAFIGGQMETLLNDDFCYYGNYMQNQEIVNNPIPYVFSMVENDLSNGIGGSHRIEWNPVYIQRDIGLTGITGQWFNCPVGSSSPTLINSFKNSDSPVSVLEQESLNSPITAMEVYDIHGRLVFKQDGELTEHELSEKVESIYHDSGILVVIRHHANGQQTRTKIKVH